MKKGLLLVVAMTVCLAARGEGYLRVIPTLSAGDVRLECPQTGGWSFDVSLSAKDGVEYLTVSLESPTPLTPPPFSLSFSLPQKGIHHLWEVNGSARFGIKPDWAGGTRTNLSLGMPLYQFFGDNDDNAITVACDEVFRDVVSKMALREEGCRIVGSMAFFSVSEAPMSSYTVKLRLDARKAFWADCVREASLWMRESSGCEPCHVPDAAFEPLYSSWYQFHQDLHEKDIEEECKLASSLGMKTVIIDDGWQTDDTGRGYAFCGDWQVSSNRFPTFKDHVKRVQDMGMKYMMWYSVPFIGLHSANYERFKGKYLFYNKGLKAAVLDPRFPEVRQWLVDLYVKAYEDWGLDGFKLDFIDSFSWVGEDPAVAENYAGRDILTVPAAVNALMVGVRDALQSRRPDVLLEFRQSYVGTAIAMYGNMFRVGDCPGEHQQNRIGICNLRLGAPGVAIHSDMIGWNKEESPEQAARAILSAMFGVIQYSVMLRDIPSSHREVIKHWLAFSQKHKNALLKGWFRPHHPEAGYPLIEAGDEKETVIGVYQEDMVVPIRPTGIPVYILNASGSPSLCLEAECPAGGVRAHIYDMYGKPYSTVTVRKGLQRLEVPSAGYICLTEAP